jgi:3D (Asp-Asp-Asp) domain-containing protein
VVENCGTDRKGPHRIDLYYGRRRRALQFGRQQLDVTVEDA